MLTITVKGIPFDIPNPEVATKIVQRIVGTEHAIETTKAEHYDAEYRVRSENRLKQDPTLAADIRKEVAGWVVSNGYDAFQGGDGIEVTVTEVEDDLSHYNDAQAYDDGSQ
ncbi:hypothetical protein ABE525_13870 [Pseudomonas wadenswilerensis]|uniref:hypothetical protein n=1 Tax=Pseudomonas wadenswilerensis TaxID=1785161 RepID=UPI003208E204